MIILHGCWIPETLEGYGGSFFLWGEATDSGDRRRFQGRPRKSFPKKHPWQAKVSSLLKGLEEMSRRLEVDGGEAGFEEFSRILFLPSEERFPWPSAEWVAEDLPELGDSPDPSIRPWEVWGLMVPLDAGFKIFQLGPESVRRWFHPGRELGYINKAVRFTHELVTRQRFIPYIHQPRDGQLEARWEPLLDMPEDQQRSRKLGESMPAAFLAAGSRGEDPFEGADCARIFRQFLRTGVDHLVRGILEDAGWNAPFAGEDGGSEWLRRLGTASPLLTLTEKQRRRLLQSYRNWIGGFREFSTERALRTGFRLQPPAEEGETLIESLDSWRLDFFLETADEETFHLSAKDLWSRREEGLKILKERYGPPVEIFLRDLGFASELFPPIKRSLGEEKPTGCSLTTEEAHQYLSRGYWLLKEGGFLTKIPSWWDPNSSRTEAQLGLKARISSPSEQIGHGEPTGWDAVLNFKWEVAVGEQTLTPEEFEQLKDLKAPLVKIRGQWVELDPESVQETLDFLIRQKEGEITLKEILGENLIGGAEKSPLPVTEIETEGWIEEFLSGRSGREQISIKPPQTFRGELRPYQREGLSWLLSLTNRGLSPCLADDMGLGKTVQFLALLLKYKEEGKQKRPSLLICPTSVVGNWCREIERFAPTLSYLLNHGNQRLQGEEFTEEVFTKDLVITSYDLLRLDHQSLSQIPWQFIALDEAQKIKNPGTKTARCARSLQSEVRVVLTGTPIENNLMELWSIMEFLNPGYLGPRARFRRGFAIPIQQNKAPEREEILKRLIRPFLLRRKKTDKEILPELPEKLEKREYCSLTEEQASLYQAVVEEVEESLEQAEGMERRGLILATIGKLKQICNHPAHFLKDDKFKPERSGKIARLMDISETLVEEGYCCLIFTQYVELGKMLKTLLQERFHYEVPFLHGGTAQRARDRMIEAFQLQKDRLPFFLLSLRAGGLGLNLTRANHVLHVDRWWNPAVEAQATDRAYRIGQEQKVIVHKFLCTGTYEENIDRLIESKKDLASRIIASGEKGLTEISTEEFLDLVRLREGVIS